jgi:hypothetical protein
MLQRCGKELVFDICALALASKNTGLKCLRVKSALSPYGTWLNSILMQPLMPVPSE